MKLHFSRLALFVVLGAALLIPATASAKNSQRTVQRPLADFFYDNFLVPQDCGVQAEYLHIPMPWDLTSSWDDFPAGYVATFRSHGMFPNPQGQKSICQVDQWQYDNQKLPFYEGKMAGKITERPLPDGTAMIHGTLQFQDLPFRVYPLSIYTACDNGMCNTDLYKPIVVDGRMSLRMTWEFGILQPGGLLSFDNTDWSKAGQYIFSGRGVGTLTGEGGFPAGKKAVVKLTEIATTGRAVGNPHWDSFPVEKVEIIVQQ